jgi:hypothetical protein
MNAGEMLAGAWSCPTVSPFVTLDSSRALWETNDWARHSGWRDYTGSTLSNLGTCRPLNSIVSLNITLGLNP